MPPTGIPTHCPYCALQCGMSLHRAAPGESPAIQVAARQFPANGAGMCRKGWTAAGLLDSPDRLLRPLVREHRGGPLRPASWDEALSRIVAAVGAAQRGYGRDAVGVFGGGGLTNEKAYHLGKFARVALRTSCIDYNGRFCMSSAASAGQRSFGLDRGLPFPLTDIPAAEVIVLAGSNLAETMPPVVAHFAAQRAAGGHLVVIDPRRTPTAELATLHLQPLPGTDLALANGLLHLVIEAGQVDEEFVRTRTTGFDDVRRCVAAYWPERVERITGIPAPLLREAARLLGAAATVMVLTARGSEQHASGTDTVLGFINLSLALGQAGRPGAGYGCLTGQGNGQGGREHGQKADQLPGYRRLDDPAARAYVAGVWGVDPASLPGPGPSAYELLDRLGTGDGVRALLVMGSNPVVSAPHAGHITERLAALDFLAVVDVVLSETAELADVVLPATQWAEETGTMTNLEGRVILRRKAIDPPPEVRSDLEILSALAEGLGCRSRFATEPEEVFAELRRASAGGVADYAGISYPRIAAEDGVFWPCPTADHPGTPRMFLDRFATPDGRARFHAVDHRGPAEPADAEFPLTLTTGRVLGHYQSGAQTRRVPELQAAEPEPYVELHPVLAGALDVTDGQPVRVVTRRGSATVVARFSTSIRSDTVFVPFHWGGAGRANTLTDPTLDPLSKMPAFKACAARLEPVPTEPGPAAP
ncbi:MAG: nitrite reductase [Pseudonocardiales bacterium]|nr:MAG: nitrite reductase [Pseudonocardiales bacterium]